MHRRLLYSSVAILLLILAGSVSAGINFDSASSAGAGGVDLSWQHTVGNGSDRILVVGIAAEDGSMSQLAIGSVTYGGLAMTPVAGSSITTSSGFYLQTDLYYLLAPPVGSDTITITYNYWITSISAGAVSFFNVAQQAAEAAQTSEENIAISISTDITPLTEDALIIDVVGSGAAGSFTATGSGMTEQFDVLTGSASGAGSTVLGAPTALNTLSWSNTKNGLMTHSVAVFAGIPQPEKASGANPSNRSIDMPPNSVPGWTPGLGADSHDVYFGSNLTDVTEANNNWPVGTSVYVGNQPFEANSYDPGVLESEQTYYWRIDEIINGDPLSPYKGSVWSFTVKQYIPGDFSENGKISNEDLEILTGEWLNIGGALEADADFNGKVDFGDYAIFANGWVAPLTTNECENWQVLHPDWIFCEDFETRDISTLTTYWTSMGNLANALTMSSDVPPQSNGVRSLQVTAKRGLNTGGKLSKTFPSSYDELYARYYVKFAYDYGYNHHFCKLGIQSNGGAGQLPVNKFWTGLEPATKLGHYYPATEYPPPGFWHFYTYWPHMKSWQTVGGVPNDLNNNPYYGNVFAPQAPTFTPRDEWICVELMIKVNTNPADPLNSDGAQRFWINGQLVGDFSPGTPIGYWNHDTFRVAPEDPRSQPYEGFRWRDATWVKMNYFKLENYVSEGVFQSSEDYKNSNPGFIINDQEAACWFDNVVISTSYIGPIGQ